MRETMPERLESGRETGGRFASINPGVFNRFSREGLAEQIDRYIRITDAGRKAIEAIADNPR